MNRWMDLIVVVSLAAWLATASLSLAQNSQPPTGVQQPADSTDAPTDGGEPDATTSQPATQPDHAPDPLSSPATMMEDFLRAMAESETKPERIKDAVRCLDLSELRAKDLEAAEQQGPLLAKDLEQIIEALLNTYSASREEIPKQPKTDSVFFPDEPKENVPQLELARSGDGLWRFSADTVAAIPEYVEAVKVKKKEEKKEAPKDTVMDQVPPAFRTPRATMRTFIEAMVEGDKNTARECLDLSSIPEASRGEVGTDKAEKLKFVVDRIAMVVFVDIPDQPDGDPYSWYVDEQGRIELARQESGDKKGYWLFNKATVNSISSLFKAKENVKRLASLEQESFWKNPRLWILDQIPPGLKGEVFGVQTWQWLGILVALVLSYILHRITLLIFYAIARPFGQSKTVAILPAHIKDSVRPLSMLVMMAVWWGGFRLLGIPGIHTFVWPALKFAMTIVGVWAAYRLIDLVSQIFEGRAAKTDSRLDDVLVPLVRKTVKIIVVAVGIVFILKAVGISENIVNKLFAGLGLGGLAFALAAKDTIANFFGSVTVVLDRPFQVGDWVKVGSAEGTVESVGLRSSRIRTFYNSQVTIPNADLMSATVDNMGRRRYRRISCKVAVTYSTTPEQLDAFCEGIRELIRQHPFTRKDYYLVWVSEFADSSINIMLYCFHETVDWTTEMRERHRLFLDIMRLARQLGVEFAFPTQTIHIVKEDADAAAPPKVDVIAHSTKTAADSLELGRSAAQKIAKASIGNPDDIPPKFEFPKVE